MIGQLAAFALLSSFCVIEGLHPPKRINVTEAALGGTATLTCNISGHEKGLFYWYKLNYGYMEQTVAMGTFGDVKPEGEFKNSRFSVTKTGDVYSLTITNVSKADEATYFCQAGAAYTMEFVNGTHLAVMGAETELFYVNQSSDRKSGPLGTTVTLQCLLLSERSKRSDQCGDERSMFWFRTGSKSHPGFISTDKISCDEEGRRCTYHLPNMMQDPLESETYYCAVVTCGQILFGEGTKVETRQELCPFVIVLGVLLGCSVLLNFTLCLARRRQKRLSDCGEGNRTPSSHTKLDGSAEAQQTTVEDEDGINYVALNFSSRKSTRWQGRREAPEECPYSNVKLPLKGSIHE